MKCIRLSASTPPSQNIPPFSTTIWDPTRIYPFLPEYTPLFNNYMRHSQNLPLPPRMYPPFQQLQYVATLPESTPPSRNIPPFSTTIILCDPPRIYPSLPEYTPPPFSTTLYDAPRIDPSLPEYTPLFNNAIRRSQNRPLHPRIYPPFNKCTCATLPESTPPSQTIPSYSTTICDPHRNYLSLPEYTSLFNNYMRPSQNLPLRPKIYHNIIVVEKGGIFCEGGIYSGREG